MFYVGIYLVAIVAANILFSIALSPDNGYTMGQQLWADFAICFAFIGLDIGLRDKLHERWRDQGLFWKMSLLILVGSIVSYAINYYLNAAANDIVLRIATASFIAFAVASFVDFLIYHLLRDRPLWWRLNGSNLPSSAIDSLIFPLIAFGLPMMWNFVAVEFAAKVLGGLLWGWLLIRLRFFKQS